MGHRILLAEDDRLSRMATQNILVRLGYEVVAVSDGSEAVDAEAAGHFDAIIMDSQMPCMDGFQATTAIRRRQAAAHLGRTPIIGLSGRAMKGDSEAAIAKGMDAYFTKPFKVSELRAALHHWISAHDDPAGRVAD